MPTAATALQQTWQPLCLQRLLHEAQMIKSIWRNGIHTHPASLPQIVARGERKGFLALEMGKQR
jgi:hypothetical protein